jgi:hypothetical protein
MTKGKDWPTDDGDDQLALKIIAEALAARALEKIKAVDGLAAHCNIPVILPVEEEKIRLLAVSFGDSGDYKGAFYIRLNK